MSSELRQYVANVRKLEIQKETLAKAINSIDWSIKRLGVPRVIRRQKNPVDLSDFGQGSMLFWIPAIVGIALGLWVISEVPWHWFGYLALLFGVGLLVFVVCSYYAQRDDFNKNERIIEENYRLDMQDDQQRIINENWYKQQYQQERDRLYNTYVQTCNVLNALYAKNVIYSKYQNDLVAICMFHEYFESGRCSVLTGHEGAYNIYEQELRMGIIINKLDIIIEKLDEIQNNQYALYSALKQIGDQQARIINGLNQISANQQTQNENLEHIRYNTAALKQNSDIAMMYSLY